MNKWICRYDHYNHNYYIIARIKIFIPDHKFFTMELQNFKLFNK